MSFLKLNVPLLTAKKADFFYYFGFFAFLFCSFLSFNLIFQTYFSNEPELLFLSAIFCFLFFYLFCRNYLSFPIIILILYWPLHFILSLSLLYKESPSYLFFLFLFISFLLFFFRSSLWTWILFLFLLTYPKISFLSAEFLKFNVAWFDESVLSPLIYFLSFLFLFLIIRWALSFTFYNVILFLKIIPKISATEKTALTVGKSWIEKNFLTGCLEIKDLLSQKFPVLSKTEKDFLNQQTEELCSFSSEWNFLKRKKLNLKEEDFLKKQKFFGLNTPKKYGGWDFSPFAHAKVVEKIASHNVPLSILTMVPNSLGPAKLLLKYGTEAQKEKYLKDLCLGEKWSCFGLTEPQAGSDASSITSSAVLFKDREELKLRLDFEKRWITLSAKADLIGLAVQLKDPHRILSDRKDLGITLMLIPSHLKGIERGFYHNPMDIPIYNAPIKGKNVVVSAESAIIGGLRQAGKGWKMLIESLSAGRAISLPSLAVATNKRCSWFVGSYSLVRKQFDLPIVKFEGVQDSLAFIFGITHLTTASHTFTLSSLNQGIVSPVVSALTKYRLTELAQQVVKKGMDIMGGAGLTLGPRNKIAVLYKALPLSVTVEGANILTRTFITYGQGLIKLHPQAYPLIQSLENKNFFQFHKNIHVFLYHFICHFFRFFAYFVLNIVLSFIAFFYFQTRFFLAFILRGGFFSDSSYGSFYEFLSIQKLRLSSVLFSLLSDLSLIALGGKLKKRGQLSGRFADWLSVQYMISALIWHHRHKKTDPLLTEWCLQYCFLENQKTALALLKNYPQALIRFCLKPFVVLLQIMPLGYSLSDSLGNKLVKRFFEDPEFKNNLCENMYHTKNKEDPFYQFNKAYELSLKEREILKKSRGREKLSQEELELLEKARKAGYEAIQVDVFSEEEYFS